MMHLLREAQQADVFSCGSIGGDIWLPKGSVIPQCTSCQQDMVLYFQLDIHEQFDLPFKSGSKLNVFCCPEHDDIPLEQYSDFDTEVNVTYNTEVHEHYSLMLLPSEIELQKVGTENRLLYKPLFALKAEEELTDCEYIGLHSNCYEGKIGGVPSWLNYAVNLNCPCGGQLDFVCQLPEGYSFYYEQGPAKYHSLFNGNFIFIMACNRQCSPFSLIAVCDN